MTKPITVLLVEDHDIVREGLRRLLLEEQGFRVVGEGDNGRVAVDMTRKLRPAVVVMDLAMPLLNGLEATRQILQIAPATKVVILSAHSDPAYIDHVKAMGAAGYLIKQTSFKLLAAAIREIMSGATFFCPECNPSTKTKSVDAGRKPFTAQTRILTSRETEVLQLIAEGHMNKEIASELNISIKTVEKHRQKLMDKLRIHESAGLTRYAINSGIIESSVRLKIL
jgi:DNA-binding NarL/FixJ family response regulator